MSVQGGEDGAHVWSHGHHGVQERPPHLEVPGALRREATLWPPVQRELRGLSHEQKPQCRLHRGGVSFNLFILSVFLILVGVFKFVLYFWRMTSADI